jgi:HPt (histidine-containing phosphotransfer) domain-containing protein
MASHSIKGMGGTMGLPEISVLGLEIEDMAKDDRMADTKPLVDALAEWMATLC